MSQGLNIRIHSEFKSGSEVMLAHTNSGDKNELSSGNFH